MVWRHCLFSEPQTFCPSWLLFRRFLSLPWPSHWSSSPQPPPPLPSPPLPHNSLQKHISFLSQTNADFLDLKPSSGFPCSQDKKSQLLSQDTQDPALWPYLPPAFHTALQGNKAKQPQALGGALASTCPPSSKPWPFGASASSTGKPVSPLTCQTPSPPPPRPSSVAPPL